MSKYFEDVIAPLFDQKVFIMPKDYTEITDEFYEMLTSNDFEELKVEEGNPLFYAKNNCIINKETKTILLGCKNSKIPVDGSVKAIGRSAFAGVEMKELLVPEGIEEIGYMSFSNCSLERVVMPRSMKKIGNMSFVLNPGLYEFIFMSAYTEIGPVAFGTKNEFDYFKDQTNLDVPKELCNNRFAAVVCEGFDYEDYLKEMDIQYLAL